MTLKTLVLDRDGRQLTVGDRVVVPCVIQRIDTVDDLGVSDVQLETLQPMFPGSVLTRLTLNATQVVLAHDIGRKVV